MELDIETITTIVNSILSTLALIIATFKKNKTKSLDEIEEKAEAKKQKYIVKQAKKNGVAVDQKSNSQVVETVATVSEKNNEEVVF